MKTLLLLLGFSSFCFAQTIDLQTIATGFNTPVGIENVGDTRLFIVEQDGLIRILNSNGTINTTPFLDITSLTNLSGERGLLGLAFHPNYTTNGLFFINYTNNSGNTVIARYSVSLTNPEIANTAAEILMTINQPYSNHNGGGLKFGPDGFLYIGMGDGGSGGDPQGYAQNLIIDGANPSRVYLGKMLRIDVNTSATAPFYTIPATNPYVGQTGREEIWAIGLRNPWKFSFDTTTGNLWIADVGQNNFEEINKTNAPLPVGLNFGWRCYEGNTAYNTAGCPPIGSLTAPLVAISHSGGLGNGSCSITGGYVYRGITYPNLQGKYIFTDYCNSKIGMVTDTGALSYSTAFSGRNFVTFGEDNAKELYVAAINNGTIYKIIDTTLNTASFNESNFEIYPNPVNSYFTIVNKSNVVIKDIAIYNIQGKEVFRTNTNFEKINTNALNSGMYFIKITDNEEKTLTKKLIIQ